MLATDLDGTFLGGSEADRKALYDLIESRRDSFTLMFVTGRDLPFIRSLAAQGVPVPDLVIGDVGTTVVQGPDFEPVAEVEDWIDSRWKGGGQALRELEARLANEPGIRPQSAVGGRRLGYFYDEKMDPSLPEQVRAAGFDCILSAGIYLDVLPPGVSKGPTLMRLVEHLELSPESILTAGDTLNDLSLLKTPFAGVAVGNSEQALLDALGTPDNVHLAQEAGAGGILEALKVHGLI